MAVYLARVEGPTLLNVQDMRIQVTDDGHTVINPDGTLVHVAITWPTGNEDKYFMLLADTIATGTGYSG